MNEQFYMRVCSMNVAGRILEYPPMTLEFETEFSASGGSAQTKVKIYNPSSDTVTACKKTGNQYPKITIDAGYQADHGTCVTGEIVKYELKKGTDNVLHLMVGDKTSLWCSAIVNRSWRGSISAKSAIQQILGDLSITAAKIDLEDDKSYNNLVISGVTLQSAMNRIARDTKSKFFFKNGQAFFLSDKTGHGSAQYLKPDTGLLAADPTNYGYKIKILFNYKRWAGSLLILETNDGEVNLKAGKGKHQFSTAGNAVTEVEAVKI
ncbi:MAG: hypothetical protein JW807_00930 [Spirochaetes bacterium]|nr:hypothetical protein [Spirochaetota bacterium]